MNDLDKIILLIVGVGACIGFSRGFFKEAVGTVGLVLAAIAANFVSPYAHPHLGSWIESETLSAIIIWVVVFVLAMFLLKKISYLMTRIMKSIQLGWVNRLAGGLFGVIKYCLIVTLAISIIEVVCAHVSGLKVQGYLDGSMLVPQLHQLVGIITPWTSEHILGPALQMLK